MNNQTNSYIPITTNMKSQFNMEKTNIRYHNWQKKNIQNCSDEYQKIFELINIIQNVSNPQMQRSKTQKQSQHSKEFHRRKYLFQMPIQLVSQHKNRNQQLQHKILQSNIEIQQSRKLTKTNIDKQSSMLNTSMIPNIKKNKKQKKEYIPSKIQISKTQNLSTQENSYLHNLYLQLKNDIRKRRIHKNSQSFNQDVNQNIINNSRPNSRYQKKKYSVVNNKQDSFFPKMMIRSNQQSLYKSQEESQKSKSKIPIRQSKMIEIPKNSRKSNYFQKSQVNSIKFNQYLNAMKHQYQLQSDTIRNKNTQYTKQSLLKNLMKDNQPIALKINLLNKYSY